MSISLILVRLDVIYDSESRLELSYSAPYFKLTPDSPASYASVAAHDRQSKSPPPHRPVSSERLQGRRRISEIVIETIHTEEIARDWSDECEQLLGLSSSDESMAKSEKRLSEEVSAEFMDGCAPSESQAIKVKVDTKRERERAISEPLADEWTATRDDRVSDEAVPGTRRGLSNERVPDESRNRYPPAQRHGSVRAHSGSPLGSEGAAVPWRGQSPLMPATIRYFSGNPSVERTEGIIHLYKNNLMTSLSDEVPRSEMVCLLSVPANMTSHDLLLFLGPAEPWIEHIKIIRDGSPNLYMVLVKFRRQQFADEFYQTFNNQPFNSIEPDTCHLVYVAQVETVKEGGSAPIGGATELPTCPVCLERMDESVDGVLTILCNHAFHATCLSKWGDTSCPVCRYVQTPELTADQLCMECDSQESLWICLICGHVGCGRYVGGHAYSHFTDTWHTYAMQLGNNRVWDYAGDNYVHRLVQNKGDGKLVEVDEGGHRQDDEKLDSLTLEYTYLLTSQLESQRGYWASVLEETEVEARRQLAEAETRRTQQAEEMERLSEQVMQLSREKQLAQKKQLQVQEQLAAAQSQMGEERAMNSALRENQSQWAERVRTLEDTTAARDRAVTDLEEQVRDLMFALEATHTLRDTTVVSQEEIEGASVSVGESKSRKHTRKKTR